MDFKVQEGNFTHRARIVRYVLGWVAVITVSVVSFFGGLYLMSGFEPALHSILLMVFVASLPAAWCIYRFLHNREYELAPSDLQQHRLASFSSRRSMAFIFWAMSPFLVTIFGALFYSVLGIAFVLPVAAFGIPVSPDALASAGMIVSFALAVLALFGLWAKFKQHLPK